MREIANESKGLQDKCWRFLSVFIDFITVGLVFFFNICLLFVFRIESRSDRQEDILSLANIGKWVHLFRVAPILALLYPAASQQDPGERMCPGV